jgi:ribosomal-protein-alanine N-acetyltransferase
MDVPVAILNTPRLLLRPWTEDDADDLFAAFSDPEAMRYWDGPPKRSVEEVKQYIRGSRMAHPDTHAGWAVVLKDTGRAVGFVNYHHRDVLNCRLEIGYILSRSFWRKGLMTEAVSALLNYCFDHLLVHRVEATTDPENVASRQFLEGLGFRFEGGPMRGRLRTSDGRSLDALMFGLLAPEWNRVVALAHP